jgi:ribosome-associated translation inhibitor RaiA
MMKHCLLFLLVLLLTVSTKAQEKLSTEQAAWLYRIVAKTAVLNSNWKDFFGTNTQAFQIIKNGEWQINYDALMQDHLTHPDHLTIFYDSIAQSPPGLIAEASVKLALWELNEHLKKEITNAEASNPTHQTFAQSLSRHIPQNIRTKKRNAIIQTVLHPSWPLFKKTDWLEANSRMKVKEQQTLMNHWHQLVTNHTLDRSRHFFVLLSQGKTLDTGLFQAAGEGSGTAGLLYETEPHPDDSTKTWYGKGIGLFTYEMAIRRDQLQPKIQTKGVMQVTDTKSKSLHLCLWGLDSGFKPLIVITRNNKSYHLFAHSKHKSISPHSEPGKSISHIDRINQYRAAKIDEPLRELNEEGSLQSILQREQAIKAEVETKLETLEAEIDTMIKYNAPSGIEARKRKIEANLSILQNKNARIAELERKLSDEYASIAKAEKKLEEMTSLLGPNPQKWHREGGLFNYEDGTFFDTQSQDLIFPEDTLASPIHVRLVSASYTLLGTNRDEVQLCALLTNAPEYTTKTTTLVNIPSKTEEVELSFSYYPDEFISFSTIPDSLQTKVGELLQKPASVVTIEIGPLPDSSLQSHSKISSYPNWEREFKQPLTAFGQQRKARLHLSWTNDTLTILALGSADVVPSRLSKLSNKQRQSLGINGTSHLNNTYLAALRALCILEEIRLLSGKDFMRQAQEVENRFNITPDKLKILSEITLRIHTTENDSLIPER